MPRAQSDIANTALRIFLQDLGKAYDEKRGMPPYTKGRHFKEVQDFFEGRCCYCNVEFSSTAPPNQDHLIPINKSDLGLHAWGNIVPACAACNNARQRTDWRDYVIERAGQDAKERHQKIQAFRKQYAYSPDFDLRETAEELYEEAGQIATTLINAKIKRVKAKL